MKKLLKVLGIILLVNVLLLVGLCSYLFIANRNMHIVIDDVAEYLAKGPITAGERLSFNTKDETMTILFDKSDFYWYIMNDYGREGINEITDAVNEIDGLSLDGIGFNFSDNQISLDAKLKPDHLPAINISVPCKLIQDGNHFSIVIQGVKMFGITIPAEKLPIETKDRVLFETDYSPALLERIDKVEICESGLKFTGPMAVNYMGMARNGFEKSQLEKMVDDLRCQYAARILLKYEEDSAAGKKLLMETLENNPELFVVVYEQILSMIKRDMFNNFYPQTMNHGFLYRVYPEYDQAMFGDLSDQLHNDYS